MSTQESSRGSKVHEPCGRGCLAAPGGRAVPTHAPLLLAWDAHGMAMAPRGPQPPPLVEGSWFHPTATGAPAQPHCCLSTLHPGLHPPPQAPSPPTAPGSSAQALLPTGPFSSCVMMTLQQPAAVAKDSWYKQAEIWMPARAGQGRAEPGAGRINQCLPELRWCSRPGALLEQPGATAGQEGASPCPCLQQSTRKPSTALSGTSNSRWHHETKDITACTWFASLLPSWQRGKALRCSQEGQMQLWSLAATSPGLLLVSLTQFGTIPGRNSGGLQVCPCAEQRKTQSKAWPGPTHPSQRY